MFCLAEESLMGILGGANSIPVIAILGGLTVAVIAIVFGTIQSMVVAKAREQTKRELAAYVAEGSISADKAVELVNAGKGKDKDGGCC